MDLSDWDIPVCVNDAPNIPLPIEPSAERAREAYLKLVNHYLLFATQYRNRKRAERRNRHKRRFAIWVHTPLTWVVLKPIGNATYTNLSD